MFNFDQISQYMYRLNVPQETRDKVKLWCQHTWKTQKTFDELGILEFLPTKMKGDVAMDVHYKTIKGVKLFHGCDNGRYINWNILSLKWLMSKINLFNLITKYDMIIVFL